MDDIKRDCTLCRFTTPGVGQNGAVDLRVKICRYNPPTPTIIPTPQGPSQAVMFPVIGAGMWCYCYEAKPLITLEGGEQN